MKIESIYSLMLLLLFYYCTELVYTVFEEVQVVSDSWWAFGVEVYIRREGATNRECQVYCVYVQKSHKAPIY